MTTYNPFEYYGIGELGTVKVLAVRAVLTAEILDHDIELPLMTAHVPFVVDFKSFDPDNLLNEEGISSGSDAVLSCVMNGDAIGFAPVQRRGNVGAWEYQHRFVNPGTYDVTLTVLGGNKIDEQTITIEALPTKPEGSANLIIRALKLSAYQEENNLVQTNGDQV